MNRERRSSFTALFGIAVSSEDRRRFLVDHSAGEMDKVFGTILLPSIMKTKDDVRKCLNRYYGPDIALWVYHFENRACSMLTHKPTATLSASSKHTSTTKSGHGRVTARSMVSRTRTALRQTSRYLSARYAWPVAARRGRRHDQKLTRHPSSPGSVKRFHMSGTEVELASRASSR